MTGAAISHASLHFASAAGWRVTRSAVAAERGAFLLDAELRAGTEVAHGCRGAVVFVASVTAVVEAVARHRAVDAVAAPAPEFIRLTYALSLANCN